MRSAARRSSAWLTANRPASRRRPSAHPRSMKLPPPALERSACRTWSRRVSRPTAACNGAIASGRTKSVQRGSATSERAPPYFCRAPGAIPETSRSSDSSLGRAWTMPMSRTSVRIRTRAPCASFASVVRHARSQPSERGRNLGRPFSSSRAPPTGSLARAVARLTRVRLAPRSCLASSAHPLCCRPLR